MEKYETKVYWPGKLAMDGGLGLAITNADLILSKVMAVPFWTGLILYVIKISYIPTALMSNN